MTGVEKDFTNFPESLYISQSSVFNPELDKNCPRSGLKTQKKRLELIRKKEYPSKSDSFDLRYKTSDIKVKLEQVYHHKCAFCEKWIEESQVEHYRPKSFYYWLSYSWDNLLIACPVCNRNKSNKFEITNSRITSLDDKDLPKINALAQKYNKIESPLLLNPENKEDVKHFKNFTFDKDGKISFKRGDKRCKYTIETCQLDRKILFERRYKILEKLEDQISFVFFSKDTDEIKKAKQQIIIQNFINEAIDAESDFLAFRQFVVKNFLKDLIF